MVHCCGDSDRAGIKVAGINLGYESNKLGARSSVGFITLSLISIHKTHSPAPILLQSCVCKIHVIGTTTVLVAAIRGHVRNI